MPGNPPNMQPYQKTIQMWQDAIELADSCARADIECNLPAAPVAWAQGQPNWWDTSKATDEDQEWLVQALRYLDARGILMRHPENAAWVSFKDVA